MTVPEHAPVGEPSLSRRFTSTTDELAGEHAVPLRMAIETETVPPITSHADTVGNGFGLGVDGCELLPPPQPAQAAMVTRPTSARANLRETLINDLDAPGITLPATPPRLQHSITVYRLRRI